MGRDELLDGLRARAHAGLVRVPGRLGARLRGLNAALGQPLASADELAERRAFERAVSGAAPLAAAAATAQPAEPARAAATPVAATPAREPAPVLVYHLDKHKSHLARLTAPLDAADIPYRVLSLEGDPATLSAVTRDSGGRKLPLVFIAGECIGGREELFELDRRGLLRKKVWG